MEPVDHLFRRESGRMVATLTRIFGIHNIALAEDVVQDAFCRALEVWKFRGIPERPEAWLMTAAKNRAIDALRRERTANVLAPELGRLLETEWKLAPAVEDSFCPHVIQDDQLRLMFSCCHPKLHEEAQIALVLHLLCGFSVNEIAEAFLGTHAAIEKRITRAKKVLASSTELFDLSDADFVARLCAVQRALYLLFNEGYHGAAAGSAVRVELCAEAMRLAGLLLANPLTSLPASYALNALMHLNAGRIPGRLKASGDFIAFADQDRSLWNRTMLDEGERLLNLSATGSELSDYHVEAAIASLHAASRAADETDWQLIVSLYDTLLQLRPSPVIALNRAVAVSRWKGPECGLEEVVHIANAERLSSYPFYFATLGDLELQRGNLTGALEQFRRAVALARSEQERRFFEQRSNDCSAESSPR